MRDISTSIGNLIAGKKMDTQMLGSFFGFVFYLLIILVLGEYLWNNVLCKVVTVVKPIKNVWQLLGIMVLSGILI